MGKGVNYVKFFTKTAYTSPTAENVARWKFVGFPRYLLAPEQCSHHFELHESSSMRKITDSPLLPKTPNQSVNCWSARCILNTKEISIWSLCRNNRMLNFKIKLNNFGPSFCAESFHHKFPKFFKENSEKKNKAKT